MHVARSLETKLTAWVAAAVASAMLLGFGAVERIHARQIADRARDELAEAGRSVGGSVRREMLAGRPDHAGRALEELAARPPFTALRIFRPDGSVAFSSRPGEVGTRPLDDAAWARLRTRASPLESPDVFEEEGNAHALLALPRDTACLRCHGPDDAAAGLLGISMSLDRAGLGLAGERWAWLGMAVATAAALVLVLHALVSRSVLRRLGAISAVIERARGGDLGARVADPEPDEIGVLGARLDEMLSALGAAHRAAARHPEQLDRLATIGQMTAGIVHEVKNALASMSAAAQTLASDRLGEAQRRSYVVAIREQAHRLDHVMRELMAFGRPSEAEPRPIDLNGAVEGALELFQVAAGPRVALERRLGRDLPPVRGEPRLLEQVLLNLFLNAREARPEGLVLAVETEALPGRRAVRVRVADNGPGLDPAVRGRLFEPFVTTKPGGTGLGLVVCRRIVSAHGGTIEARAGAGGGAVFTILLPAADGAEAATRATAPAAPASAAPIAVQPA